MRTKEELIDSIFARYGAMKDLKYPKGNLKTFIEECMDAWAKEVPMNYVENSDSVRKQVESVLVDYGILKKVTDGKIGGLKSPPWRIIKNANGVEYAICNLPEEYNFVTDAHFQTSTSYSKIPPEMVEKVKQSKTEPSPVDGSVFILQDGRKIWYDGKKKAWFEVEELTQEHIRTGNVLIPDTMFSDFAESAAWEELMKSFREWNEWWNAFSLTDLPKSKSEFLAEMRTKYHLTKIFNEPVPGTEKSV